MKEDEKKRQRLKGGYLNGYVSEEKRLVDCARRQLSSVYLLVPISCCVISCYPKLSESLFTIFWEFKVTFLPVRATNILRIRRQRHEKRRRMANRPEKHGFAKEAFEKVCRGRAAPLSMILLLLCVLSTCFIGELLSRDIPTYSHPSLSLSLSIRSHHVSCWSSHVVNRFSHVW